MPRHGAADTPPRVSRAPRFSPPEEGDEPGASLVRRHPDQLPAGALPLSTANIWAVIRSQKDLNLPAHKVGAPSPSRWQQGASCVGVRHASPWPVHATTPPCTPPQPPSPDHGRQRALRGHQERPAGSVWGRPGVDRARGRGAGRCRARLWRARRGAQGQLPRRVRAWAGALAPAGQLATAAGVQEQTTSCPPAPHRYDQEAMYFHSAVREAKRMELLEGLVEALTGAFDAQTRHLVDRQMVRAAARLLGACVGLFAALLRPCWGPVVN